MMFSVYMLFVPGENPSLWYFAIWKVLMYLAFILVDKLPETCRIPF